MKNRSEPLLRRKDLPRSCEDKNEFEKIIDRDGKMTA